ncbi:hypothetical protein GBAR_LOCUS5590 [Geodia barretti]|uniref:Uncharacterized protein n=2 Tax=Geodia barretti TaxID=519541 RepID=A0AA35WAX9_GEOBA|nr:hypothetical protein GBAR_LOCUS5590 [Geodia barretti]
MQAFMTSLMENGRKLLAWRWISVSVLVAILLTVMVVLLLPLLPYILRDSVTEYGNYSIDTITSNEHTEGKDNITCSDMFYLNLKTLTCLPQCGVWTPFSSTTTITLGVLYVATAIIGLVAGVGVLVLACLNWKKYFTYPTVLMIYQIIYGIFIMLLGVCQPLLPKDMLCSSPNLLQNIAHRKATIFCQLNGTSRSIGMI